MFFAAKGLKTQPEVSPLVPLWLARVSELLCLAHQTNPGPYECPRPFCLLIQGCLKLLVFAQGYAEWPLVFPDTFGQLLSTDWLNLGRYAMHIVLVGNWVFNELISEILGRRPLGVTKQADLVRPFLYQCL